MHLTIENKIYSSCVGNIWNALGTHEYLYAKVRKFEIEISLRRENLSDLSAVCPQYSVYFFFFSFFFHPLATFLIAPWSVLYFENGYL